MNTDDSKLATIDGSAVELARLRNQVVAQARELAVIRWEISSLVKQHPISGRVTRVKYSVLRRFPRLASKLGQIRRNMFNVSSSKSANPTKPHASEPAATADRLPGPILLIGNTHAAERIKATRKSMDFVSLDHGAGFTRSLPVQQQDEPTLRSPAAGSFFKWLAEDPSQLRDFNSIVVDVGDELSLGLLRGRLAEKQVLVLTGGQDTVSELPSIVLELDAPESTEAGVAVYRHLPPDWLDPLGADNLPVSPNGRERIWPKISVVMVSFNQASYLEEGLRSVLDQGYPNLEFIVVDGNSTDGSVEILNRYRDKVSELVIEPDDGQSDGLNKGFARATGEILTWVNSDDLLEPGALFRVAQAFRAYSVDIVAGGCRQIGLTRDKEILNHHNRLPFGLPTALPLGLLLEMDRFWLAGCFFYQPEVFFSRDIWKRSGGKLRTDLNYVLDYDLWVRMAAAGASIVHIPEFLACSRTHDQQKTTVGMPYMPEVQRLLNEYSSRLASPP